MQKRPLFRQAGDPCHKSGLGVEQPMPRISVRLTPLPQVFRHPALCWPFKGDAIRVSLLTAYWRRSSYQGDIIIAISMGQPSRSIRPSRLSSPGPLASEPAAMQGPMRKRNLGLQPGTVFAQRGPDKGPRPRRSRSWSLPLSKATASPYRENGVYEDAAERAVPRCPCLRCGGVGAVLRGISSGRHLDHGLNKDGRIPAVLRYTDTPLDKETPMDWLLDSVAPDECRPSLAVAAGGAHGLHKFGSTEECRCVPRRHLGAERCAREESRGPAER